MKIEEMHKNLYQALLDDKKYKQILESINDETEKTELMKSMQRFMNYFQEKLFNPLIEKVEKDPEFKDVLSNKLKGSISNKDKENNG